MVAPQGAAYWATLLESVYTGLESLPTTAYQGLESDGWNQAVAMTTGQINAHLEALVEIGGVPSVQPGHYHFDGMLHFAHRYNSDDDSVSQSRRVAATMHAVEYLLSWSQSDGARILVSSSALDNSRADWALVSISFVLHVPRR